MMKKGALLHTEKPFVHVLSPDLRNVRCDFCFAEEKRLFLLNREITKDCEEYVWVKKIYELFKCGGCHYVKYCDRVCQKLAWPDHKGECGPLKRVLQSGRDLPNSARVLARIILKMKRGGGGQQGWYDKNKFRMFKDLMSHYTEMKTDEKRVEHAQCLYEVLKDFIGYDALPIFSEFLGLYGRMVVNSFNILDGEMFELGTGIYLGASTVDHSCDPNAVATFSGTTISIRAIKDIKDYNWSKVRISYIEALKPAADRNKELSPRYYFECDCHRCNPTSTSYLIEDSMLCTKCSSPVYMSEADPSCSSCHWKPPIELIVKYRDVVEITRHQHEIMKNVAYLDASKMCLEKQKGLFHPDNIYLAKTLELAFEASIHLQIWDDSLDLGPKLIPCYELHYGSSHPVLGLFYLKYGKILLFKDDYEQAMNALEKAQEILRESHGEGHPLYKSQLSSLLLQAKSLLYHKGDPLNGDS